MSVNMGVLAGSGSQFQPSFTSSLQHTPWSSNTDSFANGFEHRSQIDDVLGEEPLSSLPIDIPDFIPGVFENSSKLTFKTRNFNTQADGAPPKPKAVKPGRHKTTIPQSPTSNTTTSPVIVEETRGEGDAA